MTKKKIWLSSPHMGGTEQKYINKAFESNWIAPLGPNVTGFEEDLESFLSQESKVACLSSGTAAIHLALIQLGVGVGDEVLCQSFTFCGTANPISYVGAKPIFVDSEPETWNISPKYLKIAIEDRIKKGKKPKAILLVHLYGMPCKIETILEISKNHNIPIIEDAAEALGSKYKNRMCGTFGDFSVLSFNGNKIITTSGGGALVCRDKNQKETTIFYATQAREKEIHYEHKKIGYNYRMSNVAAGIGRGQMEVLKEHVLKRRKVQEFYQSIFAGFHGITVFKEPSPHFYSNHWLSCIIIEKNESQYTLEDIKTVLAKENIESRPLWKPMHLQPIFKNATFYGNGFCEELFGKGLCLPSGSNLTIQELERIKNAILSLKK